MINNTLIIIIVILCLLINLFLSKKNKEGFNVNPTIISLSDVNSIDDKMDINTLTQIARDLMSNDNIQLKGSLNIRDNLKVIGDTMIGYNINVSGDLDVGSFNYLPRGSIVAWNRFTAPYGWAICDGSQNTPDLRLRFILGANVDKSGNTKYDVGTTGGLKEVTLTLREMPSHDHNNNKRIMVDIGGGLYQGGSNGNYMSSNNFSKSVGENNPHENMPPYIILQYIMKL